MGSKGDAALGGSSPTHHRRKGKPDSCASTGIIVLVRHYVRTRWSGIGLGRNDEDGRQDAARDFGEYIYADKSTYYYNDQRGSCVP